MNEGKEKEFLPLSSALRRFWINLAAQCCFQTGDQIYVLDSSAWVKQNEEPTPWPTVVHRPKKIIHSIWLVYC